MKTLYIIRALPGAGKSTLAAMLGPKENVFSTDDYFMKDGKYLFDGSKIGKAHAWNQARVKAAIQSGLDPIIVDNTNTQLWEAKPYVQMAVDAGYDIQVVEPNTPWRFDLDELEKRNVHGVSKDILKRMLDRWEDSDKFTVENILKSKSPFKH